VYQDYELKHVFLAIGVGWLVIAPILLVFIPSAIGNILFLTDGVWHVFLPEGTFIIYGVASLIIFITALVISIFDINKWSILTAIILLVVSGGLYFLASQCHESMGDEGFSIQRPYSFENKEYSWDDIDIALRHIGYNEDKWHGYEIIFKDGNKFIIEDNSVTNHLFFSLNAALSEHNVKKQEVK